MPYPKTTMTQRIMDLLASPTKSENGKGSFNKAQTYHKKVAALSWWNPPRDLRRNRKAKYKQSYLDSLNQHDKYHT